VGTEAKGLTIVVGLGKGGWGGKKRGYGSAVWALGIVRGR